jgi:hypothetical protein
MRLRGRKMRRRGTEEDLRARSMIIIYTPSVLFCLSPISSKKTSGRQIFENGGSIMVVQIFYDRTL